jgi:L,D-transpeptidase ErfK/SrfK
MSRFLISILSILLPTFAGAGGSSVNSAPLPADGGSVFGQVIHVEARHEDTLLDIGREYSVGYEEMVAANPGVNAWVPGAGTRVRVPTRFVLPDSPHEGLVVNLPEHRVYYYPKPRPGQPAEVITFAISIGKMDWTTPLGLTRIVDKRTRPSWYPPESVRQEHAAEGRPLPKIVPAGPDNPLGEYAMRLGIPGGAYLIHGTNRPAGVGMQVTHGCIRMFPEDVERLFGMVSVGTPVRIVNQPIKMGWLGDMLFMEVHRPLTAAENTAAADEDLTNITRLLVAATQDRIAPIDWAGAERAVAEATGVPEPMSLAPATAQTSAAY